MSDQIKVIGEVFVQSIILSLAKRLTDAGELKAAKILLDLKPNEV